MRFWLRLVFFMALEIGRSALGAAVDAAPNPATAIPARIAPGFGTIREEALRADVTFLASDALEGRLSLTRGDEAAVAWIAAEFAKAGLKPAADDTYLQAVPLVEYRADRLASFVALARGGQTKEWKFPQAQGAFKSDVDVTAPLVFAGFGITAPELGYDDYAGLEVRDRIVLVFDHEPQETDAGSIFNGTGNTRYATTRVKVINAAAHGALAVLVVAEPNRKHPSNQERSARIGGSATRAMPLPSQALDQDDDVRIPVGIVSDVVAQELLATAGASASALQAAIDRDLKPQSRALADTVVTLHFRNSSLNRGTSCNVCGLLEGSDPALAAETIIVSAHHDHDGASGAEIYHGADDNASGTAGVVALAHAFARNPVKPRRSILFVVFAAEERGLLGAFWMAAHPLRPLATTRAMINFDLIGRNEEASEQTKDLIEIPADTTHRLNLIGAPYSPEFAQTVAEENARIGLQLDDRFDHEAALNIFFRSDQFPFVLKNVPAFWFFTGFHPDYHHITDTADRINYVKMAQIVRLAYLTAWRFGDAERGPRFVDNPRGTGK